MIQALGTASRLGYAFLYLPAANFGYLLLESGGSRVTASTPTQISLLGYNVDILSLVFAIPNSELPYYVVFTMVGGIWLHQHSIYVHGLKAPSKRPKNDSTGFPIMAALAFGVDLDKLPKSSSKLRVVLTAVDESSWGSVSRFIIFLPAGLFKPLLYLSTWLLWTGLPTSSLKPYGAILLFSSLLMILRDQMDGKFPSFVPKSEVENLDSSEYQMAVDRRKKDDR